MKRSKINAVIRDFEKLLEEYKFAIPPYLRFTPEEWAEKGHEYDEIRDNCLGWDVTDYGEGDFEHLGLALITVRNGNVNNPKYTKAYAEKLIMCYPGQVSPMHYHYSKMEDLINRGGNEIHFTMYNSTSMENGELADTDVEVFQDGRRYFVPAGTTIVLKPGDSVSLYPGYYHEFVIPENGKGPVLIGEVSMVNDDANDNHFLKPLGRFPTIEEDEPPYRLLCNEYPPAKD